MKQDIRADCEFDWGRSAQKRRPMFLSYLACILVLSAVALIRLAMHGVLGERSAFLLFLPVVAFGSWIGGVVAALFCAVGGLFLGMFLVMPHGAIEFRFGPVHWISAALYLISASIIAVLTDWYQRERAHAMLYASKAESQEKQWRAEVEDRRRAEEAMRKGEMHLRSVLDSLHAFVGVITPEGILVQANHSALEAAGLKEDDVIGKPFPDTYWWSWSEEVQERLWEAIRAGAAGEPSRYDVDVRLGEGRFITIDFALMPMTDQEGHVTHLVPSGIDVSVRKEFERALVESERRHRDLAEAMPQIVWTTLPDGSFDYLNRRWYELSGRTQKESLGWAWLDAMHADDREPCKKAWDASLRASSVFEFECRFRGAGGAYRWYLVRALPVRDGSGAIAQWYGTGTDIHEKKVAEEENRRLAEQLQQAAEEQRRFLIEVLTSVTGGSLHVCSNRLELPSGLQPRGGKFVLTPQGLREVRHHVELVATEEGLPVDRSEDLAVAVGEAGMNAVVHGGGGTAQVFGDSNGVVQVWIEDRGSGIDVSQLHRATLEPGFTTADSLGHGFWMMLKAVDYVWLLTGPEGTIVVLEQHRSRPDPAWLRARQALRA